MARAADDGYEQELLPGLRSSVDAARLADELDHIVPLWQGGQDAPHNRQGLCHDHHSAKSAAEAKERNGGGIGSLKSLAGR